MNIHEIHLILHFPKFDSSALAFVCFEISSFRRVEISKETNAKADESNFNITDNLCTKQGTVSLKSEVYNQERVIMPRVQYLINCLPEN